MTSELGTSSDSIVDVDWVLKYGDPRLKSYAWMDSPYKTYLAVVIFLIYVKVIGPKMMKHKKPYNLRSMMLSYNVVLVTLSAWMFYRFAAYGWFHKYNWRCEPIDFSNDDDAVKILEAFYVYYLSKYIEFLDTIFFVLRKKNSQVTTLHVFHHAVMPIATWYLVKYSGGGHITILPLLNSFTHVMMYSYYLLSSLGPSVQKYLWWKRHITNLQMIQFVIGIVVFGELIITRPEYCKIRFFTAGLVFFMSVTFFCLFSHFYVNNYIKKKKTKTS